VTKRTPLEFDPDTRWPLCDKCAAKIDTGLVAAAASVGIEHGMSIAATVQSYLRAYHRAGHK